MMTLPIQESEETFISVREYLRTSYSPDREYVDGRVVERLWGELDHSILQGYFMYLFFSHREEWGEEVFPSLRTKISETRIYVPDVLVVPSDLRFGDILDKPPLIVIEILSPEDDWSRMQEKAQDFLAFGAGHFWVFDPTQRVAWRADRIGLRLVEQGALDVPGTKIRLGLDELWGSWIGCEGTLEKIGMTDYLIMLLSTDWFLPYWSEIGIEIDGSRKISIQQGCRRIVEEMLDGSDNFYHIRFSEDRRRDTESRFLALVEQFSAREKVGSTFDEWSKLTHAATSAAWWCMMLTWKPEAIPFVEARATLNASIQAVVQKTWGQHSPDGDEFDQCCNTSDSDWDIFTRSLGDGFPGMLSNSLGSVLTERQFRSFWSDLQGRLSAEQMYELATWYRAMTRIFHGEERPDLIPVYLS